MSADGGQKNNGMSPQHAICPAYKKRATALCRPEPDKPYNKWQKSHVKYRHSPALCCPPAPGRNRRTTRANTKRPGATLPRRAQPQPPAQAQNAPVLRRLAAPGRNQRTPRANTKRAGATLPRRAQPKASKSHPPTRKIPRREPPGVPYLQYSTRKSGACAGEVLARGGLEGTASPKEAAPPRSFLWRIPPRVSSSREL